MKKLFTGNEAIARGAYEAGVKFASSYPGTPSTEILENVALYKEDILAEWACNEKVAIEAAIGGSIIGARTLTSCKHVGLNVASDPLFSIAYEGVGGGLVIVVCDEPGQHSSQNEQDSRNYAKAAKVPMFEPASSQECKDMMAVAYDVSEKYDTPVIVRLTTRVCHSKGIVECGDRNEVGIKEYERRTDKYVTLPVRSRVRRLFVEERMNELATYAETTPLNFTEENEGAKIGVVVSGLCYNYAKEVFGKEASYLKLGFTNPLPSNMIKEFCSKYETLYVIEENDKYIEDEVNRVGFQVRGYEFFPFCGEMTPDVLRKSIYGEGLPVFDYDKTKVVGRPPAFCAGCPHRGFFYELGSRKDVIIAGDIGCYALSALDPFDAEDFNCAMGGAPAIGHGASQILKMVEGNDKKVVATIGDSTFFHTGINGLLDTVYNKSDTVTVILDNRITGMTGHQENPGSGHTLQGEETIAIPIEPLVRACGVKHVKVVNPNILSEVKEALDWAVAIKDEPSVIITRWPCALLKEFNGDEKEEFKGAFKAKCSVDTEKCIGCSKCAKVGCPALVFDKEEKKSRIIRNDCVGCEVCAQVCPVGAITKEVK